MVNRGEGVYQIGARIVGLLLGAVFDADSEKDRVWVRGERRQSRGQVRLGSARGAQTDWLC